MEKSFKNYPQPKSNVNFPNIGDYQKWAHDLEKGIREELKFYEEYLAKVRNLPNQELVIVSCNECIKLLKRILGET